MKTVIVASASPRRRELMERTRIPFLTLSATGEEVMTSTIPSEIVLDLSLLKASEVAERVWKETLPEEMSACKEALVIGADTIVSCEGKVLGKPVDSKDCREMITLLQGRSHDVYTGVTILEASPNGIVKRCAFSERTIVHVAAMSKEEIEAYVASEEPYDKAGGYGIQGDFSLYVEGIEGDYLNVVGLPLSHLWKELKKLL